MLELWTCPLCRAGSAQMPCAGRPYDHWPLISLPSAQTEGGFATDAIARRGCQAHPGETLIRVVGGEAEAA